MKNYTSFSPKWNKPVPPEFQVEAIYATVFNPFTYHSLRVHIEDIRTIQTRSDRRPVKLATVRGLNPGCFSFDVPVSTLRNIVAIVSEEAQS